jgi:hypothetical protein
VARWRNWAGKLGCKNKMRLGFVAAFFIEVETLKTLILTFSGLFLLLPDIGLLYFSKIPI